jgi:3-deoxy-7-phosphoheptulonate synthase
MSGDIATSFNSVYAAQSAHVFPYNGWQVRTEGNPLAHLVLRGCTRDGINHANYQYEDLLKVYEEYTKRDLKNPAVLVDTNHSNSGKKYAEQPRIVREVLNSMQYNSDIDKLVKGFMVESFIESGAQNVDGAVYGKSITDPCLGWPETEKLIYDLAERI